NARKRKARVGTEGRNHGGRRVVGRCRRRRLRSRLLFSLRNPRRLRRRRCLCGGTAAAGRWCRNYGMTVLAGGKSAAGSAVSRALAITRGAAAGAGPGREG
ncbi:unnamed protein product, partial [Phaeothamnion confervicola]